ncbi:ATP-binding protein [Agilicoccus flavus]|uniref:ATP-binding protein n=1 Tax=Agilicoccus flavus TaxID=2775968 RepID=UPI001CF65001|nr:ATP-binding protein [Agilicoccus flavus]
MRRRLLTLSATLASLTLLITGVGLIGLFDIRRESDQIISVVGPAADANRTIRDLMLEAQSAGRGYLALPASERASATGRTVLEPYRRDHLQVESQLLELERHLDDPGYDASDDERARLDRLAARQRAAISAWWEISGRTVEAAGRGDADVAASLARGRARFDEFTALNDEMTTLVVAKRESLRRHMRDGAISTSWRVVGATLVAMALALLVARRTSNELTEPIVALRDTMRRQRAGNRDARADTGVGASEVRQLAVDVNALTAEYHRLLDEQTFAVNAQRVETVTTRRIHRATDLREAVAETVRSIAEGLRLGRVACGTVDADGGIDHVTLGVVKSDGTATLSEFVVPERSRRPLGRVVASLWAQRKTVVLQPGSDTDASTLAYDLLGATGTAGLVIAPIGLGERVIGVVVASYHDRQRRWRDVTITSLQHIAGEIATRVVSAEADQARAEHVLRLEDLDRQKNDFMSTVSHELRTPLTSISGYLEMIEDGDAGELTPEQRRMLDVVDRNALRLRALIEDLLVLNRMESAVPLTGGEIVDVTRLLADTVEELRPAALKGDVDLRVLLPVGEGPLDAPVEGAPEGATDAGAPLTARGDRSQLGRALTNVIANAVKFTPRGGSVTVTAVRTSGALSEGPQAPGGGGAVGDVVEVLCTDTGIGIPAADQARLFTRFFRATNATQAQVPGTGLGLVVVKGIVERHRGRLDVTSVEGEGTSVRITLPAHTPAAVSSVRSGGQ